MSKGCTTAIDFLTAAKRCEMHSLAYLLSMSHLVAQISNMIHALQRERGVSNLYIGARQGDFETELHQLQNQSRQAVAAFRQCLAKTDFGESPLQGGYRLFTRLAYAVYRLDMADDLREKVCARAITSRHAIDEYSELIRSLLITVFEAADIAADPETSRLLVAMFNFMQGKEFAGQERATGVAGFALGFFDQNLIQHFSHLIDSQERCFQIFAEFADKDSLQRWQSLQEGRDQMLVERHRRMAYSADEAHLSDSTLCEDWFAITTRRIDAMKAIEDHLADTLTDLCHSKLEKSRQELIHHETDSARLSELAESQQASVLYYCGHGADLQQVTGVSPQLGKSLMELLTHQSQRLQTMGEELLAAKAALTERKKIEKAKSLLMKHRNLTEDEAHKYLRKLSMTGNRRLSEVADSIIAMADVLI